LESTITILNQRRSDIHHQLFMDLQEESVLYHRIESMQTRYVQLLKTKHKQKALFQRLQRSIVSSQSRLARLTSHEVSLEEIQQLAAVDVTILDNEVDDDNDEDSNNNPENSHDDEDHDASISSENSLIPRHVNGETDEGSVTNGTQQCNAASNIATRGMGTSESSPSSDDEGVILDPSFLPSNAQCANVRWPDIGTFWKVSKPESIAQCGFLSSICSSKVLKSILDISARDIRSLDHYLELKSAQHRSESMRNTCIDICIMSTIPPTGDAICNSESAMIKENNNVDTIDPSIPICPYELSGQCTDVNCQYQHLDERVDGSILPREFVPLPNLHFHPLLVGTVKDQRVQSKQASSWSRKDVSTAAKSPEMDLALNHSGVPIDHATVANVAAPPPDISENNDFVAFPMELIEPVTANDSSKIDEDCGNEHLLLPPSHGQQVSYRAWWMDTFYIESTPDLPPCASIMEILAVYGVDWTPANDNIKTDVVRMRPLNETCITTAIDACRHACRLIDCTRLAIHAGRFDISQTVEDLSNEVFESFQPSISSGENGNPFTNILSDCCLDLLKMTNREAFAFVSDKFACSFVVAFKTQVTMALASYFFETLHLYIHACQEKSMQTSLEEWDEAGHDLRRYIPMSYEDMPPEDMHGYVARYCTKIDCILETNPRHNIATIKDLILICRGSIWLIPFVAKTTSTRAVIDQILYPTFYAVRNMIQLNLNDRLSTEINVLKGICFVSYIILGVQTYVANHGPWKTSNGGNTTQHNEFRELYSSMDKILVELRALASNLPLVDLLLSPIFASNIALATSLKLYDTSQYQLLSLVGDVSNGSFSRYSELLWSQLIHLRMSLPLRSVQYAMSTAPSTMDAELPKEIEKNHATLCKVISRLGVYPHHLTLRNDWNIVKGVNQSNVTEYYSSCILLHNSLIHPSNEKYKIILRDIPMMTIGCCGKLQSSIPHSLLVAGAMICTLDLSGMGLRRLPLHFGLYFPVLTVCDEFFALL
jgi:Putative zinc-finger domain